MTNFARPVSAGSGQAPLELHSSPPRSATGPSTPATSFEAMRQQALHRSPSAAPVATMGDAAADLPPPSAGEEARLRWAARQLEALLIHELLKSMRSTVAKSGLFDSQATRMFEQMLDEERAGQMAQAGGMGLAELIYEQMSRHLPPADEQRS